MSQEDKPQKSKKYYFALILIVFISGFYTSLALESYQDKRVDELKDYCLNSMENLKDHCLEQMDSLVNTTQQICDLRLELQHQRGY